MYDTKAIVDEVLKRLQSQGDTSFEIEASGRHIHLDRPTIDALFGENYKLTKLRDLSQPGQYVCKERLTIAGPKGQFSNVVILGPERGKVQVEVSATDARQLGVIAPVRESGDITGSSGIVLLNGTKAVVLSEGLIVAKRHIHMTEVDAARVGVKNGQIVKVKTITERPLIFDDVVVRVSPNYSTYMHIDYDEANACGFMPGCRGYIIK